MNKIYVVGPLVLLGIFTPVYLRFSRAEKIRMDGQVAAAQARQEAEQQRTEKVRRQAAAEAEARAIQREREESERLERARETQRRKDEQLAHDLAQAEAERDTLLSRREKLQTQLAELIAARTAAENTAFQRQHELELTIISRRNADLELQQFAAIVGDRLASHPSPGTTPELPRAYPGSPPARSMR